MPALISRSPAGSEILPVLLLLVSLLLCFVMAYDAPCGGAESPVMAGEVPGNPPDESAFDAALGIRYAARGNQCTSEYDQQDEFRHLELHEDAARSVGYRAAR